MNNIFIAIIIGIVLTNESLADTVFLIEIKTVNGLVEYSINQQAMTVAELKSRAKQDVKNTGGDGQFTISPGENTSFYTVFSLIELLVDEGAKNFLIVGDGTKSPDGIARHLMVIKRNQIKTRQPPKE